MAAILPVDEIRDYLEINAEVARLLNTGESRITLAHAGGQRLLLAGLQGSWEAHIDIEGAAGPELAAELDAPGLAIRVAGSAADGCGSGMRAGRLLVTGPAGDAAGYAMAGGTLLAAAVGARTGLRQSGGIIVVAGRCGNAAGERQAGGALVLAGPQIGRNLGLARSGGSLEILSDNPHSPPPAHLARALEGFPEDWLIAPPWNIIKARIPSPAPMTET